MPLSRLPVAIETAGLAWTVRKPDVAELILTTAEAIAENHGLGAVLAAYAALPRFDAVHAPLSSGATWNLNVRISERECSELGKSIERAEFRMSNNDRIGLDLIELEQLVRRVAPSHASPLAVQLALRQAFAHALVGAFEEAASACERAVAGCSASADQRGCRARCAWR